MPKFFKSKLTRTNRGFPIREFTDFYGKECSIQKSSLADADAIWFGIDNAEPIVMASDAASVGVKTKETTGWVPYPIPPAVSIHARMHLTRQQVKKLLPILIRFADTGDLS